MSSVLEFSNSNVAIEPTIVFFLLTGSDKGEYPVCRVRMLVRFGGGKRILGSKLESLGPWRVRR